MCMVSVICPVFNASSTVVSSLRSVLVQSFEDWELLVVDDGSTDGTAEVLDRFSLEDSRVRVIHKKNTGSGDSRNVGIEAARGKYLCFLDSDDYLEPSALEFLVGRAEQDHSQILFFNNSDIYFDNNYQVDFIEEHEGLSFKITDNDGLKKKFVRLGEARYLFISWNKFYLREFVMDVKARFDTGIRVGEDVLFTLPLYCAVRRVSSTNRTLYRYSIRNGSLLHSFYPRRYQEACYVYQQAERIIGHWYEPGVQIYALDFVVQVQLFMFELLHALGLHDRLCLLNSMMHDPIFANALRRAGRSPYRSLSVFMFVAKIRNTLLMELYLDLMLLLRFCRKTSDCVNRS